MRGSIRLHGDIGRVLLDLRRLASIPAVATKLVVFDANIVDLTDELADPIEVLFSVQLGGGTDINQALAYCERLVNGPARTHLVLMSDLIEGGIAEQMLARAKALVSAGVNVIVLLALNDDGRLRRQSRGNPGFTRLSGVRLHAASIPGADGQGFEASGHLGLGRCPGHQTRPTA